MEIYGAAAAMGFAPDEVDRWEPYQFSAAYQGWRMANTVESKPKAPSAEEYQAALAKTVH